MNSIFIWNGPLLNDGLFGLLVHVKTPFIELCFSILSNLNMLHILEWTKPNTCQLFEFVCFINKKQIVSNYELLFCINVQLWS